MSTLSWNCCGLGSPRTVHELLDIVSKVKLNFVFLQKVEHIRITMGYERLFMVSGVNNGGGIALFWQENNMAKLMAYSANFIDVSVSIQGMIDWRLTCYYGFPERNRMSLSWDFLRTLSRRSLLP